MDSSGACARVGYLTVADLFAFCAMAANIMMASLHAIAFSYELDPRTVRRSLFGLSVVWSCAILAFFKDVARKRNLDKEKEIIHELVPSDDEYEDSEDEEDDPDPNEEELLKIQQNFRSDAKSTASPPGSKRFLSRGQSTTSGASSRRFVASGISARFFGSESDKVSPE